MRISSLLKAAVLVTFLVHPLASDAQTVTPADAKAFLGNWTISVDTPGGAVTVDLSLAETAGKVGGKVGVDGAASTIKEITKKGSSLVMKYDADVQGDMTPIILTVEVSGSKLTASFDAAGQVLPGAGTRK